MKKASTYKEPLGGKIGKIMGKLKHTFNAYPDLQIKFFHKQCIIWTILQSFSEFHHNLHIFKNFRYNSATINNEEKSYNKRYLPLSF